MFSNVFSFKKVGQTDFFGCLNDSGGDLGFTTDADAMVGSNFFHELVLGHRSLVVVYMEAFCFEGIDSLLANVFKNQQFYVFVLDGMEHSWKVTVLFITPHIFEVIVDARKAGWRGRRYAVAGCDVDWIGHGEGKRLKIDL
jgi:hypothetical protein